MPNVASVGDNEFTSQDFLGIIRVIITKNGRLQF